MVVLSVVAGLGAYAIEHKRLEKKIVNHAIMESETLVLGYIDNLRGIDDDAEEHLQRHIINSHSDDRHLLRFSFYDENNSEVVNIVTDEFKLIEEHLSSTLFTVEKDTPTHYRFFIANQVHALQIHHCLIRENDNIGYFEGVYKIEEETLQELRRKAIAAVVLIISGIFIMTIFIYPIIIYINKGLLRSSLDLRKANIGMLSVLGSTIAKRDNDTHEHNYRVALYAVRLAIACNQSPLNIKSLIKGAFLHDVGKIAISDSILLKKGALSDDEFEIMKTHVGHGGDIINRFEWLKDAGDVVLCHHEKYDGSGYPKGLTTTDIPINARIFAIVDVFDALTSERPYKKPFPLEKSVGILKAGRGSHFDPSLLDLFLCNIDETYSEVSRSTISDLETKLDQIIHLYFYN